MTFTPTRLSFQVHKMQVFKGTLKVPSLTDHNMYDNIIWFVLPPINNHKIGNTFIAVISILLLT